MGASLEAVEANDYVFKLRMQRAVIMAGGYGCPHVMVGETRI
jgi:hypothetical protein